MAKRTLNNLTDIAVKSSKLKPGRHSDGGGLYLNVSPTGTKSWLFMWTLKGKRREMGMGAYPAISLSEARRAAAKHRTSIEQGGDPIAERKRDTEPTFGEVADRLIASMAGSWRNAKHKYQWEQTLGDSYCKAIRPIPVSQIGTDEVLKVLTPVWSTKSETASRLRGRIERVLEYAKVKGWRGGENPALWRGHLRNVLPKREKLAARGHHPAMPYDEVPAFMARLRQEREALAARLLEFTILTAARAGEARGATWAEVDLDKAIWTVPAARMKLNREHRVPLSDAALALLRNLADLKIGDLIFPGQKRGQPLSEMAMMMLLRRMKVSEAKRGGVTVHGFRSAFRDWCGDATAFPREIAEAALAHQIGNEVEQAYRRSDALEKRRALMQAGAEFLVVSDTDPKGGAITGV